MSLAATFCMGMLADQASAPLRKKSAGSGGPSLQAMKNIFCHQSETECGLDSHYLAAR